MNLRSFVETLNVVTPRELSPSELSGFAVPGPAGSEAQFDVDWYGGPGGGL